MSAKKISHCRRPLMYHADVMDRFRGGSGEMRDKRAHNSPLSRREGERGKRVGWSGGAFFGRTSSKASADYRTRSDTVCLRAVNSGKTNTEFIAH